MLTRFLGPEDMIGNGAASKLLIWLFAGLGFLQSTELGSFFAGCWQRTPSVPCDTCFSIRKFITWQLASSEQQGRRTKERMRARKKSVFYNLGLEVTSISSPMFYLLEASHYVQTMPKDRTLILEARVIGKPF